MTGPGTPAPGHRLPEPIRGYLAHPSLVPLWTAVRARLERNSLALTGTLTLTLDEVGARRLGGLLGTRSAAGETRLPLTALDAALRSSNAGCGLLTAVADLTGSPLADRPAERAHRRTAQARVWARLEEALEDAGLAQCLWVPQWREQVRTAGLLTRAGAQGATEALEGAVRALQILGPALAPAPAPAAADGLGLGHLAARTTADAHGLDGGRLAGALVLRAVAVALQVPFPGDAAGRRRLWEQVGVYADQVSGTVLVLGLRPPGDQPWPAMLRARADLGLATHLTVSELAAPSCTGLPLARAGQVIHICENPQVLQAAAQLSLDAPLVCTSGMPSTATWNLLERLHCDGAELRYHGDFDWPGISIAARVLRLAHPWRLSGHDYEQALAHLPATAHLPLTGEPVPTPWDPDLATAMRHAGIAVHEEALLPRLLEDLRHCRAPRAA